MFSPIDSLENVTESKVHAYWTAQSLSAILEALKKTQGKIMNKPYSSLITLSVIILTGIFLTACSGENKASDEGAEDLTVSATNPLNENDGAIAEGLKLFAIKCSQCHGPAAAGGPEAPDLTDKETNYGDADDDLFRIIWYGTPNGMPTWEKNLGREDIWKVVAYLKSIKKGD